MNSRTKFKGLILFLPSGTCPDFTHAVNHFFSHHRNISGLHFFLPEVAG